MALLAPLAVAVPLLLAALLIAAQGLVPRPVRDALSLATALAVGIAMAVLAAGAVAPRIYWFGGWAPIAGVPVAIPFLLDRAGTAFAAFSALLVACSLLYSIRYYRSLGGLYHALLLVLLAASVGVGLSGDLFNLFVFLELGAVSTYALVAWRREGAEPLQGGLALAVTGTLASGLMATGIGVVYATTGVLALPAIGRGLAVDAAALGGLGLLLAGMLVKSGAVPFHFGHADAHTAGPTPALMCMSAFAAPSGLYAFFRTWSLGFAPAVDHPLVSGLLVAVGTLTAVTGAVLAPVEHDLKRLLAFSGIAHVGLILVVLGVLEVEATAAGMLYLVAHGMVLAGLYGAVGLYIAHLGTADERALAGRCRRAPVPGVLLIVGGLALAGLPPFGTWLGVAAASRALHHADLGWAAWLFHGVGALTGAAVLRAAGRTWLGLGPPASEELPEREEDPTREPPRGWVPMPVAPAILLAVALALGLVPHVETWADGAARQWHDPRAYQSLLTGGVAPVIAGHPGPGHGVKAVLLGVATGAAAVAGAGLLLGVRFAHETLPHRGPVAWLRAVHTGDVRDYVLWAVGGTAAIIAWLLIY